MSHLPTDRLAALADEAPSPDETAHLAICGECAREVRAYRSLRAIAAAEGDRSVTGRLAMPLTRWDAIAAELTGGTTAPATATLERSRRWLVTRSFWRAAAALLLAGGGALAGRASAGAPLVPGMTVAGRTDRPVAPKPKPGPTPPERVSSEATLASTDSLDSLLPTSFASIEDARRWQQRFESAFQNVSAFIAASDTLGSGVEGVVGERAYRTRLAALDRTGRIMRDALREAPADPVINSYYLTTLGQREATLRQINVAAPAGQRVIGF